MNKRKYYKTTYVVEILSEEKSPEDWDLKDVLEEAETGMFSGDIKSCVVEEVDGATMARLLKEQRSSPDFFRLDEEGNHIWDEQEEEEEEQDEEE